MVERLSGNLCTNRCKVFFYMYLRVHYVKHIPSRLYRTCLIDSQHLSSLSLYAGGPIIAALCHTRHHGLTPKSHAYEQEEGFCHLFSLALNLNVSHNSSSVKKTVKSLNHLG